MHSFAYHWLKNPNIHLWVLNPATLLPTPKGSLPFHSCLKTLDHWTKPQEGFSEDPLTNPEEIWYTDGSSCVLDGKRRDGYAVIFNFKTIEAKPLPPGTSTQLAELIALSQALELGKGKKSSLYTNSKYAFLVPYAHAAIWKQATSLPMGPPKNTVIKSLGSWRQSICPLRFQSLTVKDTKIRP